MTGLVGLSSRSGAKRKTRHRPRSNVIAYRSLAFGIIVILLTVTAASCMQPIIVYGSVAGTIKALIVTLCMSMGIGNCNQSTIDAMNNSQILSSPIDDVVNGSITASQIDSAISNLGVDGQAINAMLENTSETGAAVTSASNGAISSSLGAASAGTNIVSSAQHLAETGEVASSVGGTALGLFNGLGFLSPILYDQQIRQANMQKIMQMAYQGLPSNTSASLVNTITVSDGTFYLWKSNNDNNRIAYYKPLSGLISGIVGDKLKVYNPTNGLLNTRFGYLVYNGINWVDQGGGGLPTGGNSWNEYSPNLNEYTLITDCEAFANQNDLLSALNGSNKTNSKESPDLIDTDGNMQVNHDSNNNIYLTPNIHPIINYDPVNNQFINNNQYIKLVDWNNYEDWADTARVTTNRTDQSELLNEMLDSIKSDNSETPTSVPTQAPVNNPIFNPDNVVQPTNPEQPPAEIKPILSNEQTQEMLEGMADGSLKSRFPFCIPFDIYALFARINTIEREAPNFDFVLDLGPGGVHHVVVDFSEFDNVAALARALELILFIIGLALGARKIMGE